MLRVVFRSRVTPWLPTIRDGKVRVLETVTFCPERSVRRYLHPLGNLDRPTFGPVSKSADVSRPGWHSGSVGPSWDETGLGKPQVRCLRFHPSVRHGTPKPTVGLWSTGTGVTWVSKLGKGQRCSSSSEDWGKWIHREPLSVSFPSVPYDWWWSFLTNLKLYVAKFDLLC